MWIKCDRVCDVLGEDDCVELCVYESATVCVLCVPVRLALSNFPLSTAVS